MIKKGFKYFIGNKDVKIKSLSMFLPKLSAYRRESDEIRYISFSIKDDGLLEKYNEISEKVSKSTKKEFDREPIYNEENLKIKSYIGKKKKIHNNKIPKESSQYICLLVIFIDRY